MSCLVSSLSRGPACVIPYPLYSLLFTDFLVGLFLRLAIGLEVLYDTVYLIGLYTYFLAP